MIKATFDIALVLRSTSAPDFGLGQGVVYKAAITLRARSEAELAVAVLETERQLIESVVEVRIDNQHVIQE